MKKGKNILFLLLFIVMLLPMIAPLVLRLNVILIKMEAEEKLESNCLQTIHVKAVEIQWTEAGKEMIVNKRLFDVKEYVIRDNELTAKGLFDDQETAIEKKIDNIWDQQRSKQGNFLLRYFQFLNGTYFQQNNYHLRRQPAVANCHTGVIIFNYKEVFIKIPSPPPQV